MKYMIAIGSNLQPQRHVPWVLGKMMQGFSTLRVGRFFRTHGYHMASSHRFWNGAVMIDTMLSKNQLKQQLCLWEEERGRDRDHPQCSMRDRVLDLDLVWCESSGWLDDVKKLKQLPYLWQPILSLLALRRPRSRMMIPVRFSVHGKLLGGRSIQLK